MPVIDFSRICLSDCSHLAAITSFDQVLIETGTYQGFLSVIPFVKIGNCVLKTATTVRLSVDCICSGRIVLFAPVEHQLFVPITFFQLSHPDVSSNVQMFSVESSTVHCSYVSSSEKHNAVTKTISGHKNHIFSSKQGTVQINFKAKQGAEGCWN